VEHVKKGQSEAFVLKPTKKQREFEFEGEKESNSRNTRSQTQKIATVRLIYFSKFLIIAKRIFDISSACE